MARSTYHDQFRTLVSKGYWSSQEAIVMISTKFRATTNRLRIACRETDRV